MVSDLSGFMLIRATYTWDYEYGLPCIVVFVRELFRHLIYHGLIAGLAGFLCCDVLFAYAPRPVTHRAGALRGKGPKSPLCIGYSPADGLSVEFEGWATVCRLSLVGLA